MRRAVIRILVLFLAAQVWAQDVHYSQYFQNEVSLNPALTGMFDQDYRVSVIHRSQWKEINTSFISSTAGVEINFKEGKLVRDKVGLGVYAVNDQMGEGIIKNNGVYLSGAYRRTLDHHKHHHLSVGAQAGFLSKGGDPSGFQFGNQYENWVFNAGSPHYEDLSNLRVSYLDLELGAYYRGTLSSALRIETGVSLFETTTPLETVEVVDSLKQYSIGARFVWTGGVSYQLSQNWTVRPKLLYVSQKGASEVSFGALAGYDLFADESIILYAGLFGRAKDAGIFMSGFRYKEIEVMGSYDMTTSNLRNLEGVDGVTRSGKGNAFEVSVNFLGVLNKAVPAKYTVPCGIF